MSTIKSQTEHLTLNADGSGKEIKFQCNGTEVAKIDSTGFVGAGSPSIDDNGNATAITIDSSENVGIGVVPQSTAASHDALYLGGNGCWTSYSPQGASGEMDLQHNAHFHASGVDKYISTDEATKYRQGGGKHNWYTATSGSGNVSWSRAMTIDNAGIVTMPSQPAFYAAVDGGASSLITNWDWTYFNNGNHFNATSGLFTAPVSGNYSFTAGVMTGQSYTYFYFKKNGSSYGGIHHSASAGSYSRASGTMILYLSANDTLGVGSLPTTTYASGTNPWTQFSGHLIG